MCRRRKIGITFVCLLLSCGYSYAQQDSIYTLKQCIETAIGNNLSLQQKGLEREKKQYDIMANRAKLLPVIKAYGNFTNQVDKSTSLSLSNPLGDIPWKDKTTMKAGGCDTIPTVGCN
ncbi:MAG: TolC family protein [Bacteroides sp.]|nr:TolC family protein [Bacteroides sp.]